jgi:hypothetical protein
MAMSAMAAFAMIVTSTKKQRKGFCFFAASISAGD